MKFLYVLLLSPFCVLYSCNLKSSHPQADIAQDPAATAMNEKIISHYADSLDKSIDTTRKKISLIYTKGQHSFYAEQYEFNGKTVLLSVYEDNGALKNTRKKYYFKNDSLILVRSSSIQDAGTSPILKDSVSYLRNHTVFKITFRSAASQAQLKATPFHSLATDQKKNAETYLQQVDLLKDAIQQQNQFEMVFESINGAPDEKYLILKSKTDAVYEASVLLTNKDALIDSLQTDPLKFKGEKIHLNWTIKDKQAIYVPVASKVTSARGLNK
jgi:hypothetical protein